MFCPGFSESIQGLSEASYAELNFRLTDLGKCVVLVTLPLSYPTFSWLVWTILWNSFVSFKNCLTGLLRSLWELNLGIQVGNPAAEYNRRVLSSYSQQETGEGTCGCSTIKILKPVKEPLYFLSTRSTPVTFCRKTRWLLPHWQLSKWGQTHFVLHWIPTLSNVYLFAGTPWYFSPDSYYLTY